VIRKATITIGMNVAGRPSRDNGGVFNLVEMPAEQAADWFMRAMQFLVRSGTEVPPHIFEAGPAGFFAMGIGTALAGLSKAPWFEVKPLLAELLGCVESYQAPGGSAPIRGWEVIKTQIQEPATIFLLYEEVVSLSLGFSLAERFSNYRTLVSTMMAAISPGQNTETSTGELPPSSEAA
jgi:hypothetical protein